MHDKIKHIKNLLNNPYKLFVFLIDKGYGRFLSDRCYIKAMYLKENDNLPNLNKPEVYSEKLQWLKLHDRNPLYTTLVDKYSVKEYVSKMLGKEYVIKTLGVYSNFDDIDFNALPNQFVLKCTHDSGGLVICKDKAKLDIQKARDKINTSLKRDYYLQGREYPYKNVPRKIIAEEYMGDENCADLTDYKFYCFNGVPCYCQVIANRNTRETIDFFDMNWEHQNFTGLSMPYSPFSNIELKKPKAYDEMIFISKKLSEGLPFARIDLYYIQDKVYFGEITLYPAAGFGKFVPDYWNKKLGDLIMIRK